MTHRKAKIKRHEMYVTRMEINLREAEENLKFGKALALATYNKEISRLQSELDRAKINLDDEIVTLQSIRDNITDADGDL